MAAVPRAPRPGDADDLRLLRDERRVDVSRALPHGVWGDPRGSSAELGEQFFDQIARAVCVVMDDVEATLPMAVGNTPRL